MYKFDNSETEVYFFEMARMYDIRHVNFSEDKIITMDDVDNIVHDVKRLRESIKKRR